MGGIEVDKDWTTRVEGGECEVPWSFGARGWGDLREAWDAEGPENTCQCVTNGMMALRELILFATD